MNLSEIITPDLVIPNLVAHDKEAVLAELAAPIFGAWPHLEKDRVIGILMDREKLGSTGIGEGIAIPHGKLPDIDRLLISFGRSVAGVDYDSMDGQPAHLFFLLLAPESSTGIHLKALAKLAKLLKNASFRAALLKAADAPEIVRLITAQEAVV